MLARFLPDARAKLLAGIVAAVLAVAGLGLALAGGESDPGEAAGPAASSTAAVARTDEPTQPLAPGAVLTEVATVKGPNIDVLEVLPGPPAGPDDTSNPTPATAAPGRFGAIPRDGFETAGARRIAGGWEFDNPTYYGNPLAFTVTERRGDWLRVRVPTRPNLQQGWVRAADVDVTSHTFRIEISLSTFTMKVYDGAEVWIDTQVVIGTSMTPTPLGSYYVTEKLSTAEHTDIPRGSYGSWVLPLNGYSESMDSFDGGLPVIALHGTLNPATVGQARSNGCVRVPDDLIVQMAERLPVGTPVEIVA